MMGITLAHQGRRREQSERPDIKQDVAQPARALHLVAERLARLSPLRRWAWAFVSGAVATLALSPFNVTPVLLLALPCLVWQIDAVDAAPHPWRAAAAIGWWFGFGFHLVGIHWIGFAFMVDAGTHAWMIPFVALAMPGGLALFTALATLIGRIVFDHLPGAGRVVGLAVLLVLGEWLRGTVLTGFPWNLVGYTWASFLPVAQAAALIGVYGLSLLTLVLACAPAALVERANKTFQLAPRGGRIFVLATGLFVGLGLWGGLRLATGETGHVENVRLRIVQPSIPQKEKWRPENRAAIFEDYLDFTRHSVGESTGGPATHVIWPESAVPFLIDRDPGALDAIGRALGPGRVLLTGAARVTQSAAGAPAYFNAVHIIDAEGTILETYDKAHLVPFGEYVPLAGLASRVGLQQLAASAGGFSSGPGPRLLDVPGAGRVLALICYEAIFPGRLSQALDRRPDWLLNVTNDAWFGTTTGPHQHFTQSRFRAIEEGLPLVRAANTGISGIIDAHGRIEGRLGLGHRGVLEGALPKALPVTLYARLGNLIFAIMVLAIVLVLGLRARHPGGGSKLIP